MKRCLLNDYYMSSKGSIGFKIVLLLIFLLGIVSRLDISVLWRHCLVCYYHFELWKLNTCQKTSKPKPFPFGLSHILYWRICLKVLGFKEHSTQNVAWDDKDDLISMCIMADISFCFFYYQPQKLNIGWALATSQDKLYVVVM